MFHWIVAAYHVIEDASAAGYPPMGVSNAALLEKTERRRVQLAEILVSLKAKGAAAALRQSRDLVASEDVRLFPGVNPVKTPLENQTAQGLSRVPEDVNPLCPVGRNLDEVQRTIGWFRLTFDRTQISVKKARRADCHFKGGVASNFSRNRAIHSEDVGVANGKDAKFSHRVEEALFAGQALGRNPVDSLGAAIARTAH